MTWFLTEISDTWLQRYAGRLAMLVSFFIALTVFAVGTWKTLNVPPPVLGLQPGGDPWEVVSQTRAPGTTVSLTVLRVKAGTRENAVAGSCVLLIRTTAPQGGEVTVALLAAPPETCP